MKKRTQDELREASNHLYYEYTMLRQLAVSPDPRSNVLRNAILESRAIHLRNLADFFYGHPEVDDESARHFFDEGVWQELSKKMSARLEEAKRRANKEVAHMTYRRTTNANNKFRWEASLGEEIESVMKTFLREVDRSLLGSRWGQTKGEHQ